MVLARATWKEVDAFDREAVVLIPTGSLEQHGTHLPLFTDSILATAAAEAVERALSQQVVLTPTLWLGASAHHLAYPGSLSADFSAYIGAIQSIVESLRPHGFRKFFIVNGHGGNTDPNSVALRELKADDPEGLYGAAGYFDFIAPEVLSTMQSRVKTIRHACEAETSLMLHIAPELVRKDLLRDDGLIPEPPVRGLIASFDEMTDEGSFGQATLADADLGRRLFESAVAGLTETIRNLAEGFVFLGDSS